jgi:hypothetical protein
MHDSVFWDTTLRRWVSACRLFEGTCRLHPQLFKVTKKCRKVFSNRDIQGTSYRLPILLPHNPLWDFIMDLENLMLQTPSKRREPLTPWYSVTSQKTGTSVTPLWKPRNLNDITVNLSQWQGFPPLYIFNIPSQNRWDIGGGGAEGKTGNSSEFLIRCTYCSPTPTPWSKTVFWQQAKM